MTEKDIYSNGVALLEEWEDVNYCEHSFKFKDEWLTDKEVVDLLNTLYEKNNAFKNIIQHFIVKEFKITKEDIINGKGGDATDFSSVIDEFFNNEVNISEIQVELKGEKTMTEKRFTIDEDGNITDTKTDRTLYVENKYTECNYFFRLLNDFHEENQQLKKREHEIKKIINNLEKKEK